MFAILQAKILKSPFSTRSTLDEISVIFIPSLFWFSISNTNFTYTSLIFWVILEFTEFTWFNFGWSYCFIGLALRSSSLSCSLIWSLLEIISLLFWIFILSFESSLTLNKNVHTALLELLLNFLLIGDSNELELLLHELH